jgi:23S rRNA (adenine2030-N6)-methyltransferase
LKTPLPAPVAELVAPYLEVVRAERAAGNLYPGSPRIALALARPQDRLVFSELHPDERAALKTLIRGDRRARLADLDGWSVLKAELPPAERRGVVLIDPPFEEEEDFCRFETGLQEAHRRWATGIILFWYPIKQPAVVEKFLRRISRLGIPRILRLELTLGPLRADGPLKACGLLVVNPPWRLDEESARLLPVLAGAMGEAGSGRHQLQWLTS